jgi:hypothetical protein
MIGNCILRKIPGNTTFYNLSSDGWFIGSSRKEIKDWPNPEGMMRELLSTEECDKLFEGADTTELEVELSQVNRLDISSGKFCWFPKHDKNGYLILTLKNNDKN